MYHKVFLLINTKMFLQLFAVFLLCTTNAKPQMSRTSENLNSILKEGPGAVDSRCTQCICEKESNCNHTMGCGPQPNASACGPYQIKKPYFQDCCRFLGMGNCNTDSVWKNCALDYNCATRCVEVKILWQLANYMLI